jgi:transformation/transcription domain-associated protein
MLRARFVCHFGFPHAQHHLIDVCINALTKIYTLPNIEIHDAFLKLREQAKCYLNNMSEYATGLEVINNTNLGYFQPPQRAEFWAIKAMFLSRLNMSEEANQAFSTAIQIDVKLSKGWSAWAQFNDKLFAVRCCSFGVDFCVGKTN